MLPFYLKQNNHIFNQNVGCGTLIWTGLNSIWDLKIPFFLSLLSFPILKRGLLVLSERNCKPTEEVLS